MMFRNLIQAKYMIYCVLSLISFAGKMLVVKMCNSQCCDLLRKSSNYADIMNVNSSLGLSITFAVVA